MSYVSKLEERNAAILALKGKKSYGLIAEQFKVTRSTVAGVMFRKRHPYKDRICSPNSKAANMVGTGWRKGKTAKETLPMGPVPHGSIA